MLCSLQETTNHNWLWRTGHWTSFESKLSRFLSKFRTSKDDCWRSWCSVFRDAQRWSDAFKAEVRTWKGQPKPIKITGSRCIYLLSLEEKKKMKIIIIFQKKDIELRFWKTFGTDLVMKRNKNGRWWGDRSCKLMCSQKKENISKNH